MTLEEVYKNKRISVRSYNVCRSNKINTIGDLKAYYDKYGSFDNLRNCGRRSNGELIKLCLHYENFNFNKQSNQSKGNKFREIISELSRLQRDVINSFIYVNTQNLSNRSRNAINSHLNGNLKVKRFSESFYFKNTFDVRDLKNVGRKSIPELEIYLELIKNFILEVKELENEKQLISLKNKYLIQKNFSISEIPTMVLESESIFLLTDYLINKNALFDSNQTTIIKRSLKIFKDQESKNLEEIGEEVNLTRERVRQIRKICIESLFSRLLFIQNFNEDLLQNYNLDINSVYLDIDSQIVDKINNSNNINFSKEFITYILYTYLFDRFSLIGDIEDVLQPKYFNSRGSHDWNNFYLISKEIATKVDFEGFANDISKRLTERIKKTYSFNFKGYLSRFIDGDDFAILKVTIPIVEKLVNEEFSLFLDLDDNISFQRNTVKQVPEYIVEALENLGKPSKITDIYNWINSKYPGTTKNVNALRGSCQRDNRIIYFGRSSTFGLKRWEKTRTGIKGGTIKEIVSELLEKSNTPLHVNEILDEVHKYRNKTNERNIITNLKLDPYNSFLVFNQKFIGLSAKKDSYNIHKYENLPLQLGKIINGLIARNKITTLDQMNTYLQKEYQLTKNEIKNILRSLKIKL